MNDCTRFWALASTGAGTVGVRSGVAVSSAVGEGSRPTGSVAVGRGGRVGVGVGAGRLSAQATAASDSQANSAQRAARVRIIVSFSSTHTLAQPSPLVESERTSRKGHKESKERKEKTIFFFALFAPLALFA
jgi:hypothetical protein